VRDTGAMWTWGVWVGRTPGRTPLVTGPGALDGPRSKAGQGAGRGPGGPPHHGPGAVRTDGAQFDGSPV